MDEFVFCPSCRQPVKLTDYFCPNCGKNLHLRPLSTSASSQIALYLKTLLLPPFGFLWGYRYLRQSDSNSKLVGWIVIIITTIEIIWLTQSTISMINTFSQQIFQPASFYGL
jgi:hypothetical protein